MPAARRPMAQLHQPRLAEVVAEELREQIVNGDIEDGGSLPSLEGLARQFGVSVPSIRQALRILESENLLTVRRGNVGGSIAHRPTSEAAATMLGLVLQSRSATVNDVLLALIEIEPICARLCAERTDRRERVVPKLEESCRRAELALDDASEFQRWTHQFHNSIIECCGNETLGLVAATLTTLWGEQDVAWSNRLGEVEEKPSYYLRDHGVKTHWRITEVIAAGDAPQAEQLFREHMKDPEIRSLLEDDPVVRVTKRNGRLR